MIPQPGIPSVLRVVCLLESARLRQSLRSFDGRLGAQTIQPHQGVLCGEILPVFEFQHLSELVSAWPCVPHSSHSCLSYSATFRPGHGDFGCVNPHSVILADAVSVCECDVKTLANLLKFLISGALMVHTHVYASQTIAI